MATPIKLSPMVAPFLVEAPGLKELAKIQKNVGKISKKIGDSIGSIGKGLTVGFTLPIVAAGAAAIKLSTDANRSLANIATLIPGQTKKILQYKDGLNDLAVESGTSFETLSEGLYQSISALGDGAQAFTALKIANKAAIAGVSSTKDAITLLSGVSKGYNDTSDEMLTKISDLAFSTVKLGVTTFPELAASMGKVTPIASSLNIGVDQLFGNMATLTGVTGDTSEVSTQLASVMGALLKGSSELDKSYKKLGVKSGKELIEKTGGLNEALFALQGSVKGSETAFANLLGRKEAILAGFALTGIQAENARIKIAAMGESVGATDEAFREQSIGINKSEFQLKQFIERVKVLGRQVGDKLIPILSRLGEKVFPIAESFMSMSDAQLEGKLKTVGMVAALGPLLMVVGKLFTGVGALVGALGAGSGLSGVLVTLTGPVGIITGAFILLGLATAYFWNELKPIRDVFRDEFSTLFGKASSDSGNLSKQFKSIGANLKELVKFAAPIWAVFAKIGIVIALMPLKDFIKRLKRIVHFAKNMFSIFSSVIGVFSALGETIGVLWEAFKEWFNGMADSGNPFFATLRTAFSAIARTAGKVYEYIKKIVNLVPDLPNFITDKLAKEAAYQGGHTQRVFADVRREIDLKTKDKIDINIKVDGGGSKVGVKTKGHKARITDSAGEIMPLGDPI